LKEGTPAKTLKLTEKSPPLLTPEAGHSKGQQNMMSLRAIDTAISDCAELYRREKDLNYLIAVWPNELTDYSLDGTAHIVARIQKVISAHKRARADGHWSESDNNRFIALHAALKAESARLEHLKQARGKAT
jgi:hypothetical protein